MTINFDPNHIPDELPIEIQKDLYRYPALQHVIEMCFSEKGFVSAYNKLTKQSLPKQATSPIHALIDDKFQAPIFKKYFIGFSMFVYDFVWLRTPNLDEMKKYQPN